MLLVNYESELVAVVYALLICEQCPYDEVCEIYIYHPSLDALRCWEKQTWGNVDGLLCEEISMARCPDVQLKLLSRLMHRMRNFEMARLTQIVLGVLVQRTLRKRTTNLRDLFRHSRICLSYACGNPWSWLWYPPLVVTTSYGSLQLLTLYRT
jgi:hypothetical protein